MLMQQDCNNKSESQNSAAFWKGDGFVIACIVLLSGILCGLMLNPYLTVVNHDSAIFCLLGEALALGKGYVLESGPVPKPYFTFPPLLPLMIALWMKVTGVTDPGQIQVVLKGWVHVMFLASLPVFYHWARTHFSCAHARILTVLLAVNPIIFKYSSDVLSDVPYWLISLLALFFLNRWRQLQKCDGSNKPLFLALGLGCILLSAWTRQVGVALSLGFLLYLGFKRHWKVLAVSSLVLFLGAALWPSYEHHYRSTHVIDGGTLNQADVNTVLDKSPLKLEFIKHFLVQNPVSQDDSRLANGPGEYLNIIATRVQRYGNIVMDQLVPPIRLKLGDSGKVNIVHYLTPVFAGLFLWGIFSVARSYPIMAFYLFVYLGVFSVYPYISPRFILPVFPFVLMGVYQGLLNVRNAMNTHAALEKHPWVARAVMVALVGVILLGGHLPQTLRWVNAGYKLKLADDGPSRRTHNKAYYKALMWVGENTPEDSLIVTRKPPVSYYYARRNSVAFPFTSDTIKLITFIEEQAIDHQERFKHVYVLEDTAFSETQKYLTPMLETEAVHFASVYEDPAGTGTTVWQLRTDLLPHASGAH